jgi:hypothetical protein
MPTPLPAPHVPLGFPSLAMTDGQTACPDGPTTPRTVASGQIASPGGPIAPHAVAPTATLGGLTARTTAAPLEALEPYPRCPRAPPSLAASRAAPSTPPTSRATPTPMTTDAPPAALEPYPRCPRAPLSSTSSRSAPTTSAMPNAEPSTPPTPCATPASTTTAAPPTAPEAYLCRPQATQEPLSPPLHQQSPPAKAIQVASPVNPHPMIMRVKWGVRLSADKLTLSSTSASIVSPVPSFIRTTLVDPNSRGAMEKDFAALIANNTWDLVPHSVGSNVVTNKWIFKHKFNSDGFLEWSKARWVLCSFTQRPGVNYDECDVPTLKNDG